jgi:hypothetical protein
MTISASLGIAIFFLGAAVGVLLKRLQWNAFKQMVLHEIMEQREGDPQPASDALETSQKTSLAYFKELRHRPRSEASVAIKRLAN